MICRSSGLFGVIALAFPALTAAAHAQAILDSDTEIEAPIREGEEPVIPLDTGDPTYSLWSKLRDADADDRKPGLINVQNRDIGFSYMDIPTFFRQPVALTPADLAAGKVDIAMIGAYPDMGTGRRGAAHGPQAFRTSEVYGGWGVVELPNMHVMVDLLRELVVADFGDAPNDFMSTERTMHGVREFVRSAAEVKVDGRNVIPIVIGGDHSLMYADVAALVDVYGKGNVGVIHFDAHYDATKYMYGHLITHGMPVYRLIEEGLVEGKDFIQVGLRGYYPDKESFEWCGRTGSATTRWPRWSAEAGTRSWRTSSARRTTGRSTCSSRSTSTCSTPRSCPGPARPSPAA
jgi:agmatinase